MNCLSSNAMFCAKSTCAWISLRGLSCPPSMVVLKKSLDQSLILFLSRFGRSSSWHALKNALVQIWITGFYLSENLLLVIARALWISRAKTGKQELSNRLKNIYIYIYIRVDSYYHFISLRILYKCFAVNHVRIFS